MALPLTAAQSAIWCAQRLHPEAPFAIAQYVELRGRLDLQRLMDSYRHACEELHVGCRIVDIDGAPHVMTDLDVEPVGVIDLRDEVDPVDAAHRWMRGDLATPIDMYDEHLVVSRLLRCGDDHCFWYSSAHHIALDGYGAMRIIERTTELYAATAAGTTLPALRAASPAQLLDEDRAYVTSSRRRRDGEFWADRVAALPVGVGLARGGCGNMDTCIAANHVVGTTVPKAVELGPGGLHSASRIVAAFAAFLAVSTETNDVVLTLPVSARTTAFLRRSAGSVSNVLPLHIENVASGSVATAVDATASALASVLRRQRFRRENIGRILAAGTAAPTTFGPIVNLMMFQQDVALADVTGRVQVLATGPIADLAINVYPGDSTSAPRIDFEANGAVYTADDIAAHHRRFMSFLEAFVTAEPSTQVGDIDLFAPGERPDYTPARGEPGRTEVTLDRLLAQGSAGHAQSTALVSGSRRIDYDELNARSNRLARRLIGCGLGPEDVVAVAVSRSIDSVVAFWAAAKAGVAHLPVDPRHPTERVRYVLADSGAAVGLTMPADRAALPSTVDWLYLDDPGFEPHRTDSDCRPVVDDDRIRPLRPHNPAYIIYTSGSTGTPKGVAVTHTGLANLTAVIEKTYGIDAQSRVLHLASPTFDTALVEMLASALAGATLVIAPTTSFGGQELGRLLRREHITHLFATPSALATVDPTDLDDVKLVVAGGEPCPPALVRRWSPGRRFRNAYGPTETTCSVTLSEPMRPDAPVTIGGLMCGVHATVLDGRLRPRPPRMSGELHLAGDSLARGYHNSPALTAAHFVANPYGEPGSRMFRTGDHVCWNPDATLEFRGRLDDQVKVRGLRIELGAIDAVLGEHPGVRASTTVLHRRGGGEPVLASYVVVEDPSSFDNAALTGRARRVLPDYMVPTAITALDALPLTPTGKVDHNCLPTPRFGTSADIYRAPTTETERIVADAFADVLGIADVGVDHAFFDLGGDSLSATRVVARVNDRCGVDLGVRDLFDAPTPAGLAARATNFAATAGRVRLGELPLPEVMPLAPAQRYIERTATTPALYNIPFTARIRGPFDPDAFGLAVRDLLGRHPSLRTVYPDGPEGPYQRLLDVHDVLLDLEPRSDTDGLLSAGFDVRTELPFRIALTENNRHDHTVACVVHHIAVDGWSMSRLSADLVTAYVARAHGSPPEWQDGCVQYADYTIWQLHNLGSENDPSSLASSQIDYWRETLDGFGRSALSTDRPRPTDWTYRGARVPFTVDARHHRALVAVARDQNTGVFTALHSAVAMLTARLTGSSDVTIGTPVSGRGDPRLDDLVGMFVNTVVLRTHVTPTMSLAEVMTHARESELGAFANADVRFERLVEVLDPPRSPSEHPFFRVAMSLENFAPIVLDVEKLSFDITPRPLDVAKCDLHFYFTETFDDGGPNGIDAQILYSTDLFDETTVRVFAKTFCAIVAPPDECHTGSAE